MPRKTKAELEAQLAHYIKFCDQITDRIQELAAEFAAYKKLHVDTDLCQHRQAPCAWAMKLTAEREAALDEVAALKARVIRMMMTQMKRGRRDA